MRECTTLVDLARTRADQHREGLYIRYLETGDTGGPIVELGYAELVRRAEAIGAALQQHGGQPGDRALLLFPSGVDFVTALFGCLFAGVIAVPAYPPDLAKPERTIAKLRAIATDCGARFALTVTAFQPTLERIVSTMPELAGIRCLAVDASIAQAWQPPQLDADAVAIVQYTSGSTGTPKGAVIRHRQLIANEGSIAMAAAPLQHIVSWLPVFHDMGLIGNVLHAMYAGVSLSLMSPVSFLKRPARWLEAITRYRGTASAAPNFAYDLCVRRVTADERARLDLTSWEVALCGAEPVRDATIDRFCATFGPHGFARTAFFPCYGLAEATLFVTGAERGREPTRRAFRASVLDRGEAVLAIDDTDRRMLVSCGKPSPTEDIRIVEPEQCTPLAEDVIGEIWVRGPAIASGYWGRDDPDLFAARLSTGETPYLRTGDLGFIHDGELFITGRRKDLIIIAGRNLYPQDLEATVETIAGVRRGCCVAFSIERDHDEKLVIVAEHEATDVHELGRALNQAVLEQHQVAPFDVVLVPKGTVPKTSSGKLERYACRHAYTAGTLAR